MGIIFAFLYFTIDIFRGTQLSLTGYNAHCRVSTGSSWSLCHFLFLNTKDDNFLTVDDKQVITREYESYMISRNYHSSPSR